MLRQRRLVDLSREGAEAALKQLLIDDPDAVMEFAPSSETKWLVRYERTVIGCRDEDEAKLLTRDLCLKGHRVTAQTVQGFLPARIVEPDKINKWLDEN